MRHARLLLLTSLASVPALHCNLVSGVLPCDDDAQCPTAHHCEAGACVPGEPARPGTCDAPFPLEPGMTDGDTRDGVSEHRGESCKYDGGDGRELIYQITPPAASELHVLLWSVDREHDLQVSVRSTCADAATALFCADAQYAGNTEEVRVDLPADEPAFVIVDGFAEEDVARFTLVVELLALEGGACTSDHECAARLACVDGACEPGVGDSCELPIVLVGTGGTESGDTADRPNVYEAREACTEPNTGLSYNTEGGDSTYQVTIPSGATFTLDLTPPPEIDLSLFVYETCPPPTDGSCTAMADTGLFGVAEQLVFTNDGETRAFFIAVDGFTADEVGPYTFTWTLTGP